jgi:hypothetical protein
MSRLAPSEVDSLQEIAHEIRETWSARGHHVGQALSVDRDFVDNERPRSALTRAIVTKAFELGARKASVGHENGPGGSKELHTFNDDVEHIFRLLKASIEDDEYVIRVKDDAMIRDLEITLMGRQERWVFAYTLDGEDLDDIFVAEVLGVIEGNPGRLTLGTPIMLGVVPPSPQGGFRPDNDEDLDLGGESAEGAEGDESFGAGA